MAFLRSMVCYQRQYMMSRCYLRYYSSSVPGVTLAYSEEVQQAKHDARPILALESTIITHGMPYPKNLETALQVEDIVRQQGAIPATVAILKGQLTVGLTQHQLEYLASAKDVVKASRRDMAAVVAGELDGATTVAGTIVAADLAGIPVFATGGIGGVHRGAECSMDVSADLVELGRSRTMVVCSGVKSILDIGRTLEYLETQGVCVCAFGESREFPAFYTPRSGHVAPHRVLDALHAAKMLNAAHLLQLQSGSLVAVPIPQEHAMDENIIEGAIEQALQEANSRGIFGKEITPFLLAAVSKATSGASLNANIALIKNNAKVGADIAVQFNKLRNSDDAIINISSQKNISQIPRYNTKEIRRELHTSTACPVFVSGVKHHNRIMEIDDGPVLIIGGANVDRTYKVTESNIKLDGSTHTCEVGQCGGGVGRNIGETLWRLRGPGMVHLITAIGDDTDGHYLCDLAPGLIVNGSVINKCRTPSYAALLGADGECALGLGDMTLHGHITPEMINKNINLLKEASLVVMDGNPPVTTIEHVLQLCKEFGKPGKFIINKQ